MNQGKSRECVNNSIWQKNKLLPMNKVDGQREGELMGGRERNGGEEYEC